MKFNIKKNISQIIFLCIVLLAVVNLYHLLMENNYLALLCFFIIAFLVYLFNRNNAIILGVALFVTNIINSFTNLFSYKLIEGLTNNEITLVKNQFTKYYNTLLNAFASNPTMVDIFKVQQAQVNQAFAVASQTILPKYASISSITQGGDTLNLQLIRLYGLIADKKSSKDQEKEITLINEIVVMLENDMTAANAKAAAAAAAANAKAAAAAAAANAKAAAAAAAANADPNPSTILRNDTTNKPLDPKYCNNITDTKLCCISNNKKWDSLTGVCSKK